MMTDRIASDNPGQNCLNTFGPVVEISPSPPGSMKHDVWVMRSSDGSAVAW